MVRLKVVTRATQFSFTLFQFQYGAIKRAYHPLLGALPITFQFQYGAIKSPYLKKGKMVFIKFQFQYGAIKSSAVGDDTINWYGISIPIWCD